MPEGGVAYLQTETGAPLTLVVDPTGVTAARFEVTDDEVRVCFATGTRIDRVRLSKAGDRTAVLMTHRPDGSYVARVPEAVG